MSPNSCVGAAAVTWKGIAAVACITQGWVAEGENASGRGGDEGGMGMGMGTIRVYAGIDVSKAYLDAAERPEGGEARPGWRVANDAAGIDALVARLLGIGGSEVVALVVLEATGGLEAPAAAVLALAGLPMAIVNPRRVRDFARGVGRLAKTDELDAQALAHYGEAVRPEPKPLPDAQAEEFGALLARRRQVVGMLTAEKNRLHSSVGRVRAHVVEHIAWLEGQMGELDRELDRAVRGSALWREKDELLRSVPGVGPVLSTTLLAELPELGELDHGKVAALAGVAPLNRDSGKLRGRRTVWGGRARLRAAL